jgi:putative ABC transport system permease protein
MRMILGNDKMEAVVLQNRPKSFEYVNVKITSNNIRGTLARLEDRWKRIDPLHPMKYQFYNDELAEGAQGVFDVVSILGFIALLAVLIACMGMLGMAMYTTERRRKEVGIRKVLGASNVSNVLLLSREFVGVLVVAVAIAAPLSYFLNTMWLRNFPNRVEFGWGTVLTGVAIVMGLGLVTIGSQTITASRRNPVEGLRAD